MTDNERNMSRDEMALRLKIETGLRESYESECTKLKKELENIKVAFKIEHDENISRRDNLNRLCDKYRDLEKKHEDLQKRQNACADTWVKHEDRIDELKENEELRTKLAYSEENADKAKSVSDDILRRDCEINQLKIQNKMLENSNKLLLGKNLELKNEKKKLEEINKKLQDDYDSLKLTYGLMKLNPGYFTLPTQPINIENLNVTYYENGPVLTSEEEETEDDN